MVITHNFVGVESVQENTPHIAVVVLRHTGESRQVLARGLVPLFKLLWFLPAP